MKFGIDVAPFGEFGDPNNFMRIAETAEAAGWDGLFTWDHLGFAVGMPSTDAFTLLTAAAVRTGRIKLGTAVTPIARRRVQTLAQQIATLDLLSSGRFIFGAGLGGTAEEFEAFGEDSDPAKRAARLDDGLTVLRELFSGETVTRSGPCGAFNGVTLQPLPPQGAALPFWIGGSSRAATRRALRWNGWLAPTVDEFGQLALSPEEVSDRLASLVPHWKDRKGWTLAVYGWSSVDDTAMAAEFQEAGARWWLEPAHGMRASLDECLARIKQGPPQL